MKLSIVSSLFQSEDYIEAFTARARAAAKEFGGEYEIILVNDGSTDQTLEKAYVLASEQKDLVIINLSRNFGHHKALMEGIKHSKGDYVFVLDSDLEEDPAWLGPFYTQMKQDEADVVCAVQKIRKGKWLERVAGAVFYKLFNWMTDLKTPPNAMVARLMSRRFVNVITAYPEQVSYLPGLFAYSGFKQVTVERQKGSKGRTSYSLIRRIRLAFGSFIRFSDLPLKFIFYLGGLLTCLSFLAMICLGLEAVTHSDPIDNIYILLTAMGGIGGIILLALGMMSFYLLQIFNEIKNRPNVIIESIYSKNKN